MELIFRLADEDEHQGIVDAWVRSFEPSEMRVDGDPFIRVGKAGIAPKVWYRAHRLACAELVKSCTVIVATTPRQPTGLLGWVCHLAGKVHYVFVVPDARRKGIASELLRQVGDPPYRVTHTNAHGRALIGRLT